MNSQLFDRTHFICTDSTQEQAKRQIETLQRDRWQLFTADEQTKGRGQHSRSWCSPPFVNLYATYLIPFATALSHLLPHAAQVATIAVAKTVEEWGVFPKIKWVNDLMLDRKKMGGVLCETTNLCNTQEYLAVLVGIGMNINMPQEMCDSIDQPATSLFVQTGCHYDKEAILQRLSHHLYEEIQRLIKEGFTPFHDELHRHLAFLGEKITVKRPLETIEGLFVGVDQLGHMQLQVAEDQLITLQDGRIFNNNK